MSLFGPLRVRAIVGGRTPSPWLAAVVELPHCSGTLVTPNVVLTSAHCLDGPIDHVIAGGHPVRVAACWRHPAYERAEWAHDIGYCRLAETASPPPLPLDDGPRLAPGEPVSLAGFGRTGAFAHDSGVARVVDTSVTRVGPEGVEVGTETATACQGDSGGPVVVQRQGQARVAGVIHGGSRAICASAAQVVAIGDSADWLKSRLTARHPMRWEVALVVVLAAGAGGILRMGLRRRSTARGSAST